MEYVERAIPESTYVAYRMLGEHSSLEVDRKKTMLAVDRNPVLMSLVLLN